MNPVAERIKDQLTMGDVLERYGIPTSRNGRIPCPIHHGKDKNFSYSDKYYKCFVCGKSGSVIDFAMDLFDLDFRQAIIRLNDDFGMNLLSASASPVSPLRERNRILEERRAREREKATVLREMNDLTQRFRDLQDARHTHCPKCPDDPPDSQFIASLQECDYIDYRIWELFKQWKEMG